MSHTYVRMVWKAGMAHLELKIMEPLSALASKKHRDKSSCFLFSYFWYFYIVRLIFLALRLSGSNFDYLRKSVYGSQPLPYINGLFKDLVTYFKVGFCKSLLHYKFDGKTVSTLLSFRCWFVAFSRGLIDVSLTLEITKQ